jgi:OOP family OmpA-OmpF porin
MARAVLIALLAVSGAAAASQAAARGPFYAGGSVGSSDIEDRIAIPGLITSGTVDGEDTGYKIFGGYEFIPHFGVEIAWVDLGKARYSGLYGADPVTGGSVEVYGLNASAVGILPLNSTFALFGKIGVFSWEARWRDVTGGVHFSARDNGADVSFGLGFTTNFTSNVSARVEWERFKAGGGEDFYTGFPNLTGSAGIDLVSLGLLVKF